MKSLRIACIRVARSGHMVNHANAKRDSLVVAAMMITTTVVMVTAGALRQMQNFAKYVQLWSPIWALNR